MLCRSLPLSSDPAALYARLSRSGGPWAVLDSGWDPGGAGVGPLSRFCICAVDPFALLTARGDRAVLTWKDGRCERGSTLSLLRDVLERFQLPDSKWATPFPAGAMGYFGYELGSLMDPAIGAPSRSDEEAGLPDLWLGLFDSAVTIDQERKRVLLTATGRPHTGERARQRAESRIRELAAAVEFAAADPLRGPCSGTAGIRCRKRLRVQFHSRRVRPNRRPDQGVHRRRRHLPGQSLPAFPDALRGGPLPAVPRTAPRGAGSLLRLPGGWRLRRGQHVPGTLPAPGPGNPPGRNPSHQGHPAAAGKPSRRDRLLARELVQSGKDRAEHVMIVDLERNDLGRVARVGTVQVRELSLLETFPTLFHLTSTVEGILAPGRDRVDLPQGDVSRRVHHRGSQDPGHAGDRRAGNGPAGNLHRIARVPELHRRDGSERGHSHHRRPGWTGGVFTWAPASSPTATRKRNTRKRWSRAGRCGKRWRLPKPCTRRRFADPRRGCWQIRFSNRIAGPSARELQAWA